VCVGLLDSGLSFRIRYRSADRKFTSALGITLDKSPGLNSNKFEFAQIAPIPESCAACSMDRLIPSRSPHLNAVFWSR
jgi:hypothetical protein